MSERFHVGPLEGLSETEGRRVQIGDRAIALFRRGERVHAVDDSCPHAGACLSEGRVDGGMVVCPWHGWAFDLETGRSPFDDDARLSVYRVAVEGGEVYIELDASAGVPAPEAQEDGRRA